MAEAKADVVLVGGGLANSLIALRLKQRGAVRRIVMLERSPVPETGHTWSFFATDVARETLEWLESLTVARWAGYDVQFPEFARALSTPYRSITASALGCAVERALGADLVRGAEVVTVAADRVVLADGRSFEAPLIVDGRGARASQHLSLAWQKFVGLEFRLDAPHGLERPVVMDASVQQLDGFRFLYVLPLSPETLLVEDTRYSTAPELDASTIEVQIRAYVASRGWRPVETLRTEQGILPIALGGDIDAFWAEQDDGVPRVGMRAALFHPTTGYSLPEAARTAEAIAAAPALDSGAVAHLVRTRSAAHWRQGGFFRGLNRMMFLAARPAQRYRVLERFYRLPAPLIERFYAGRLDWRDRIRLLAGEPPVPVGRALWALRPAAAFARRPAA